MYAKCDSAILIDFYTFSLALIVLVSLDENYYCSLGSRIKSMELAVTNTADLLIFLRVIYNKVRQASITNEIIEILNCTNVVANL
jgi:F0F1-type ATP synthase gamma subunit